MYDLQCHFHVTYGGRKFGLMIVGLLEQLPIPNVCFPHILVLKWNSHSPYDIATLFSLPMYVCMRMFICLSFCLKWKRFEWTWWLMRKLKISQLQRIGGASMSYHCIQLLTELEQYAYHFFEFNLLKLMCLLVLNISTNILSCGFSFVSFVFKFDVFAFWFSITRRTLHRNLFFIRVLVCLGWMWKPPTFSLI